MEKNSERQNDGGGDACERGGLAMKTPDRNRIAAAAVSQFEDSPVFNYINSLSPIKTVKSLCTSQTFNSCSFSSLPAIFSSPHMSSLKDPRLLRRCYSSDSSKPEFSCQTENKGGHKEVVMDVATEQPESFESCIEQTYECPELASQISGSLNYDCRSPETQHRSELASTSGSQVPFLPEAGQTEHLGRTVLLEETRSIELDKEGIGCDWQLISDASDFLIFESPNNTEGILAPSQKLTDSITRFCTLVTQDDIDSIHNIETDGPVEIEQSVNNHPSQSGGNHHSGAVTSPNKYVTAETCEQADNELASSFQRGGRRRCLTFDMSGIHKRHLDHSSSSGSAMLSKSDASKETNSTQPLPMKPINSSSFRLLPGIGLHLNAIARTSKESNVVSHETFSNSQEGGNKHVTVVEQNIGPHNSGAHSIEDASQTTFEDVAHDESNNSSPRKKRPRVQNAGEPESCKRCNCKKSKCLKLYCECFAAGVYCVEPCSCQDCFNKPIHEDTVLATRKQIESRNPLAFAPKVIRTSDSIPETGDESNKTPASARHKRGCNCKKSGCLKKYCECYQGGVGCSINCRCEGCKNAFGTKDASLLTEAELEEENEASEKNAMERSLQKIVHPNGVERIQDNVPATPLRSARTLPDMSFSSKSKPPRSSFLSIGSTTGFYGSQTFGKPNFLQPPMFEKRIQALHEAETPEILQGGNSSLGGGVKSSSPNSKRVSPPHCSSLGSSSSGGRKSSRKLILQSIPSFPSLTPKP